MKNRMPLLIVDSRLILIAAVESKSLRINKQLMKFVIDTGSPDSYLNYRDVTKLQIPIKGKKIEGEVDFGGSRFKQVKIPRLKLHVFKENKQNINTLEVRFSALKTTKTSQKNIQNSLSLPSILGMNFLKDQKLSLYLNPFENVSFLEF